MTANRRWAIARLALPALVAAARGLRAAFGQRRNNLGRKVRIQCLRTV